MISTFSNWLRAVTSAALPPALPPTPSVRDELRALQARRVDADMALQVAIAGTERARQTIRDAALAEEDAAAAEAEYVASAATWAANGALGDVGSQDLIERAEKARARAYRARLAAKGATAALTARTWDEKLERARSAEITQAEADARDALKRVDNEIGEAAGAMLVAEIEPTLERAMQLHSELVGLLPLLVGFTRMSKQNTPFRGKSGEIVEQINIVRSLPKFDDNEMFELMQPWLKFGRQLMADPDSLFDTARTPRAAADPVA